MNAKLLCFLQCLIKILFDIIDMLDTDAQPYHVRGHASRFEFFLAQLSVSGRGRVSGQGFGISNVHETLEQTQ